MCLYIYDRMEGESCQRSNVQLKWDILPRLLKLSIRNILILKCKKKTKTASLVIFVFYHVGTLSKIFKLIVIWWTGAGVERCRSRT